MKIMKVVYLETQEVSDWDGSNSRHIMYENTWAVGEPFAGEFIQGVVHSFVDEDNVISMYVVTSPPPLVKVVKAISFPIHAIQRMYYGE